MKDRRLFVPAILAAIALAACLPALVGACGGSAPPPQRVTLQLNWFHEAEFVGYYVAEAKGFYAANGLDVRILEGGPGDPARAHVLDGTADFAISSFAEQRDGIVDGDDAVALMSAFQIPPLVIFSLKHSGVREPADLAGRRVGITTEYWREVLEQTLAAAGVKVASVTMVDVAAGDLRPLYGGEVDAWLGYAQDEPIQAEIAGHPVAKIYPADYGVGGYEGLLLARDVTIAARPDLVRRFVRASERGWRYALEHPDEAATILLEWAPEPGLRFQKLAVRAIGPLVDVPQVPVGWIDASRWRQLMADDFDEARPGYSMRFSVAPH